MSIKDNFATDVFCMYQNTHRGSSLKYYSLYGNPYSNIHVNF